MRLTQQQYDSHQQRHFPRAAAPPCPSASETASSTEPPDAFTGPEKLLHRDFAADMQRRGAWCVTCRTDRAATIPSGYPDFHVLHTGPDGITRGFAVEFKKSGGSCSPNQIKCIAEMRRLGIPVLVAWTLRDAIDFAKRQMGTAALDSY